MVGTDEVYCPVCKLHTVQDSLQAQGVMVAGMQAVLDRDQATIAYVYATLSKYDGHTAIGVALDFLQDLCDVLGKDIREALAEWRRGLNEAIALQA